MHISATFHAPRVNFARFRQSLHEQLSEALAQAATVWLQATATEIVPVWSAASRATFSPLASHVGYVLALSPVADAPNRIDLGIANGTGTFETDASQGLYRFTYSTTLPHLIINEYYNANTFINPNTGMPYFRLRNPGPYHFQEAGQRAFREFASGVELPGWGSILDTVTLRVG